MAIDALRQRPAFGCGRNNKGATIRFAHFPCDQSALGQTIENAGQRRSLVRETPMEIGDAGWRRLSEKSEDMGFTLGQLILRQDIEIKADPVGGPMDWLNKVL